MRSSVTNRGNSTSSEPLEEAISSETTFQRGNHVESPSSPSGILNEAKEEEVEKSSVYWGCECHKTPIVNVAYAFSFASFASMCAVSNIFETKSKRIHDEFELSLTNWYF